MKEQLIRKKATEILEKEGYLVWHPAKVKWHESDIFGVFDLIAVKHLKVPRLIQLTTLSNISARKHKILRIFKTTLPLMSMEVWGWDSKKKKFKIVVLN